MVGFLTLSPEETEIVLGGGIEEPRYRPFPGSRKDRDEDNYSDDEDEVQADQTTDIASARLERTVAAKHWRRSSSGVLLMVARDLLVSTQESKKDSETLMVVAVSYVRCGPRTSNRGTRRMFVGPWKTVAPFPVLELLNSMKETQHRNTLKMVTGHIRELPKSADGKVAERLREVLPDYPQIRAELMEGVDTRRSRSERELQRRDAVATALNIFRQKWRSVEPVPPSEPSAFAEEIDETVRGVENDFIDDDAAVFPGWERFARSQRGWWEFRSRNRQLRIKNINKHPAETRTGADLIYVRRAPDAVVLVQYKMLERLTVRLANLFIGPTRDSPNRLTACCRTALQYREGRYGSKSGSMWLMQNSP